MDSQLTLSEEFVLLSLDKRLHRFKINFRTYQETYTAGIVFIELLLDNWIRLDEKGRVQISKDGDSGMPYLDLVLHEVGKASRPKTLKKWVKYFYSRKKRLHAIFNSVVEGLERNKAVQIDKDKLLGVIPKEKLVPDNSQIDLVIERIRAELLEKGKVEHQTIALCFLLAKLKLLRSYFSKHEEKRLKERLEQLQKENPDELKWVQSVRRAVDDLDAALATTIGGAVVTP